MAAGGSRRLTLTRVLTRFGDRFYAVGPALVLVLAHEQSFAWNRWSVLLLAFGAQVVFDASSGFARTWFAERIRPSDQAEMTWLYLTDAALSCIGLVVAAAAVQHQGLILLSLPLIGLFWFFARERHSAWTRFSS